MAHAEESIQNGAKLGAARGDIVYYAGSDTPGKWYVIDAEKSNTDDTNGMLLLNKDEFYKVNNYGSELSTRYNTTYAEYYNKAFSEFYRGAVMTVSKTDEEYKDCEGKYKGKLTNDIVFALSLAETEKVTDEEKKGNQSWWLRSYKEKMSYWENFQYKTEESRCAYIETTGKMSSFNTANVLSIKFRPAVNLDKTKL